MRKSLLFLLPVLFLLTSCAALFQPKVAMGNSTSNGSLSDLLAEEEEITTLPPSAQILASEGLYSDRIQVTWQPVAHAVSYVLERAVRSPEDSGYGTLTPPEDFVEINSSVYGTSYTDVILEMPGSNNKEYNNEYWYRVYAENKRDKYDPSAPTTTTVPATLFASPQGVDAAKAEHTDYIEVRWNRVQNASEYIIYRTTYSNGTGAEEIARVKGNLSRYQNIMTPAEQGKDFYYFVKALNSKSGEMSASSNIALGYSLMSGAPQTPAAVQVKTRGTSTDGIELSWQPVTADGDVKYALFRYSSEDAALTQLKGDAAETTWTDKNNVKPGIYYYYQVQAWVMDDQEQKLKSPLSAVEFSSEGFLLSAPSGISVDADTSGQSISWNPAIGNKDEQSQYTYKVLGSNNKDAEFTSEVTVTESSKQIPPEEEDKLFYDIVGTTYKFYQVKTLYKGQESKASETVAPSPLKAENLKVSRAKNLGPAYQANSSGVYPVELTWDPPTSGDAAGYHVYRSTSKESGFRKITESPVTECTYIDQNDTAKAGKYYYYRVLAVNELEQGKNYSDTMHGYGALTHKQYILEFNKTVLSSQKKLTKMHAGGMGALGEEKADADVPVNEQRGNLYYNATGGVSGASITMKYTNYCDFNNEYGTPYFILNGNSDTEITQVTSQNGYMKGVINCTGMYPGSVSYDKIQIKGGNAGGGTYGVQPEGFERKELDYRILN